MTDPSAVIIGSGIGGTAAALLMAQAGIPTTLIEKNRRLGGSCSSYEKHGFHIDIGTHMFCRGAKGPLGDVLRRAGEDGAISFRRTRDISEIRLMAPDGRGGEELVKFPVPAELHRMPIFARRLARAMRLSPREAIAAGRLFAHILTMSESDARRWDAHTVEQFVAPFTKHGPTLTMFGFLLGLYFILPYWEVSAGEALLCFRQMAQDNALSYPIGGSIAIPSTYARLAEQRGARVIVGAGVRRVLVRDGRTEGVELDDGTVIPASIVISTSSVRTTVRKLVGEAFFPAAYVARANELRGSYIAVQAKIGLRKPLVSAGSIIGGVGEGIDLLRTSKSEVQAMMQSLDQGRVPAVVPFYCPVPSNFDPSLAPPGCQLLTVCSVAPTSDVALTDPGPVWEEAMLRAMRRVIPGLDEHAMFIDRFSVEFIERWIGKEFGPAVSTAQTPDQVGRRRPPVFTPIRGLYMAGCGAGGRGVGTELAAQSAIECVERILADLGRPLVTSHTPDTSPTDAALSLAARFTRSPLAWVTSPPAAPRNTTPLQHSRALQSRASHGQTSTRRRKGLRLHSKPCTLP